ncbi:ATP-binding protein [Clostridium sp. E02]|uniref:ATP-binding protein n=1 Tax=Clostridium sp. E02 TaxID=2487134 RepID=UPI000F53A064|nr:ATP-binding protein [Clostridium sp. E02]
MALSNSQYDAIMRAYGQQQFKNRHEQEERVAEVYKKIPVMKELDDSISSKAVSCARRLLDGEKEALKELRNEIIDLREQKSLLLKAGGFKADYLEMHYNCTDCKDTGYKEGIKCHCFRQLEMKYLYAQSNIEQVVSVENFDTFRYEYFDDTKIIPVLNRTVKQYMGQVVETCKTFAETFVKDHGNLLFTGPTGVGKTFLTNCIAKELMERYYSVIYLSANDLFEVFSKNRFDYQNVEDMKGMYQYILDCDLLIIDDLGTELNNSFTSSELFTCINERLNTSKSTIISTNHPINELRDRYTERVTSRLISRYTIIPLYGDDIRIRKKAKRVD